MQKIIACLLCILSINLLYANERSLVDSMQDRAYAFLGDNLDSADLLATNALIISEKVEYKWGIANSLYVQGYVYHLRGELSKALIKYLKAHYLLKDSQDSEWMKTTINLLLSSGAILFEHYKYEQAIDYYGQALILAKALALKEKQTQIYFNLGLAYRHMGDLDQAGESVLQALRMAELTEQEEMVLNCWNQLGLIYKDKGTYDAARASYLRIVSYPYVGASADKHIGRANHNIAVTYYLEGKYEPAREFYLAALQHKDTRGVPKDLFVTLLDLTELYLTSGEHLAARETGLRARLYYDAAGLKAENFHLFSMLAKVHFALKDYEQAEYFSDLYVQENEKFKLEQEEVLKMREQFKMDLILAGFYQEVSREEDISSLETLIGFLAAFFTLAAFASFFQVRQKRLLRRSLEKQIREIQENSVV